jgi:hypothetical protein
MGCHVIFPQAKDRMRYLVPSVVPRHLLVRSQAFGQGADLAM